MEHGVVLAFGQGDIAGNRALADRPLRQVLARQARDGLISSAPSGSAVTGELWHNILTYDHEIRKDTAREMQKGTPMPQALRGTWTNSEVKMKFFTDNFSVKRGHDGGGAAQGGAGQDAGGSEGVSKRARKKGGPSKVVVARGGACEFSEGRKRETERRREGQGGQAQRQRTRTRLRFAHSRWPADLLWL